LIKAVYSRFPERIAAARQLVNKPLTLTEKILYAHLWEGSAKEAYARGGSYVDFAPDRVAMQDATAQMALLQFMQAGRKQVAVPSTVHCDHLIQARVGAKTTKCSISYLPFPTNTALVSGSPVQVSFIKWC
jgi:aconitate hydratase